LAKESLTTASDGKQYSTNYYNLDVVISVGYRVKSHRGTQFRIWATKQLKEFLIKGFLLNDEKLKEQDIPTSISRNCLREFGTFVVLKRFSTQKLGIFTPLQSTMKQPQKLASCFLNRFKNKMHWAIHGHTASEIISQRASSKKQTWV